MTDAANDQGNPNEPLGGPPNAEQPALPEVPLTLEEGRALLRARPDAFAVMTEEGRLRRDGLIDPA